MASDFFERVRVSVLGDCYPNWPNLWWSLLPLFYIGASWHAIPDFFPFPPPSSSEVCLVSNCSRVNLEAREIATFSCAWTRGFSLSSTLSFVGWPFLGWECNNDDNDSDKEECYLHDLRHRERLSLGGPPPSEQLNKCKWQIHLASSSSLPFI